MKWFSPLVLVCGLLATVPASAQPADFEYPSFRVYSPTNHDHPSRELAESLERHLTDALRLKGLSVDRERPHWTFWVAAEEGFDGETIALAVVVANSFPERIVERARSEELFYTGVTDSLPAEGAFVRQMVTEDWIRQYGNITQMWARSTSKAELQRTVQEVVEEFWDRHFNFDRADQ